MRLVRYSLPPPSTQGLQGKKLTPSSRDIISLLWKFSFQTNKVAFKAFENNFAIINLKPDTSLHKPFVNVQMKFTTEGGSGGDFIPFIVLLVTLTTVATRFGENYYT